MEETDESAAVRIHLDPNSNLFNPNKPSEAEIKSMFQGWLRLQDEGRPVYNKIVIDNKVVDFGGVMVKKSETQNGAS